jgi:hypothetical protein
MLIHGGETIREPDSSVSIVTGYGLGNQASIPDRGGEFFLYLLCQAGSGAHPASCTMDTGGSFPRGKVQLGCDADHSTLLVQRLRKRGAIPPHSPSAFHGT